MQKLIIFLGDYNSEKDSLIKLLPKDFNEIVFEKLIIKERVDQGDTKLLLINFPEENEITQAFSSLLTLSQYFRITQIVFCLNYHQTIIQKVQNIQKKLNQELKQEVEKISTYFISNSPQMYQEKNSRIYQFYKLDELNKKNIIRILEDICFHQNNYISQINLENTILQQQEKLRQRINILNKQFQEEYLPLKLEIQLEILLQKLLSNKIQPLIQPIIEISDKNIKQNQIILYSDAIYQLCQLKQQQIKQQSQFIGKWFKKVWHCFNCKALYSEQDNKMVIYNLLLFQFDQNETESKFEQNTLKCFRCQQYLTQRISIILPIFEKIYIFQQIQKNLKINGQFYIEANKQQTQESKSQIKIRNKEDCIAILLLSDEDELKQFVMHKVYDIKNYKERNQFKEGQILNDSFYLIDTPIFLFDEDPEELESIYSNYINSNPIHFIIFCLKLQRSSLIKERLLIMLKKLPNINKQAFSALIIDENNDISVEQSPEYEITNSIKGIIPQTALIQNSINSVDIIKKISDFILNIEKSKPISFEETIFYKSDNEQDQKQIQTSLILMSESIKDQFKQNCEQEIKDEEARLEDKEQQKIKLKQEISNLTREFQGKKKELTDLIYSIQQELDKEESNYKKNITNLNTQLTQTETDLTYSSLNIRQKRSQLNQMEYEKIKKNNNNLTIHQNRRTKNR